MVSGLQTRERVVLGFSCVLLLCGATNFVAGIKVFTISFKLTRAYQMDFGAGAIYSGALAACGALLLLAWMLKSEVWQAERSSEHNAELHRRHYRSNLYVLGMALVTLSVLASFVGAIVDGEAFDKSMRRPVECSEEHHPPTCFLLKYYSRLLLTSTIFNGLEGLLGAVLLFVCRQYHLSRLREASEERHSQPARDETVYPERPFPPSYETYTVSLPPLEGVEDARGGSVLSQYQLPGYSTDLLPSYDELFPDRTKD